MDQAIVATYRIQSFHELGRAAEILAGEQSSGTFVEVPGESDELRARHGARILELEEVPPGDQILPGSTQPDTGGRLRAAIVRIAFPLDNVGVSLPAVLTTVAGNLYELRELAGVKLTSVEVPDVFPETYGGPRFGVAGTRELIGVRRDPLLGTIIKPSVGLPLEDLSRLVRRLVASGVDFIKDDELIADPPYSRLEDRVRVVMREIDEAAERTGKKVMYAFNITDDIGRMERHAEAVRTAGGTCVMVCVNVVGVAGLAHIVERAGLPVHGHRAMLGAIMRHPELGIGFDAFQTFARIAGVDHLHTSGFGNKFYETDQDVARSIEAVQRPIGSTKAVLPVLSSAQWAGSVPTTWHHVGSRDLLMVAGGGILAHPDGLEGGVQSMRAAWDATIEGNSLEEAAKSDTSLARALQTFA